MRKIVSSIIPVDGFIAITLWPFVFVRKGEKYTERVARHEEIHGEQQKEMFVILFLLWYGIEWVMKFIKYRNRITAYKNVSFEREAYANEHLIVYDRKHYAWIKYL